MNSDRRIARGGLRAALLGGVAATLLATTAVAQQRPISFDIAAQDAGSALNDFSRQSGMRVLFPYDSVEGKQVPALRGDMTVDAALLALSKATGLVVAANDGTTVTLTDPQSGSAAGGGAEVEALIVTAQKREEDIQDVPIAISAFTAKQLEAQKIEGGFDLMKAIPNVTFSKNNFTSYNFSIRGVGTKAVSATTDPGVAVAFNNTTLIQNRLFEQEYFDVERVEVLRGPQGTLYGRNATSGVINVISAKPDLNDFDGYIKGEVGNFHAKRLSAMINLPLVEDVLAVRLAGATTDRQGYDYNSVTENAVNGRDLWSARLSIGFSPNDRIHADLIWERFNEDDNRSRTGKQLCHRDPGPEKINNTVVGVDPSPSTHPRRIEYAALMRRAMLSQGCKPGSLYDDNAFGTPNGLALPFVFAPLAIGTDPGPGLPFQQYYIGIDPVTGFRESVVQLRDPYGGEMQSRDMREIASIRDPIYRAKADILELNVDVEITDTLTFYSQTAYVEDEVYSFQDFNRFNTSPTFTNSSPLIGSSKFKNITPNGVFCDPQIGCSDTLAGFDISKASAKQFSQEFRLQSEFDGPVNFSLGANYTRFETLIDYYVMYNLITMTALTRPLSEGGPDGVDILTCAYGGYASNPLPTRLPIDDPNAICPYIDPNPVESINGNGHNYFRSKNPYDLESWAGFGEAYWNISDTLKLTAGLRYTDDKKTFIPVPSQTLLAPGFFAGGLVNLGYPEKPAIVQKWGEWTGRIGLDWSPEVTFTDDTLLYAFYSRGYKGGGANPAQPGYGTGAEVAADLIRRGAPPAQVNSFLNANLLPVLRLTAVEYGPTFDPEFVDAFEVGAKNTALGGAMTFNVTGFYYDYKDYQVSQIRDRTAVNENFDAEVWGVEFETVFAPSRNLQIVANLGYLDTEIADGETSIDIMNRTQGDPDYTLVKPWSQLPSNCVVPTPVVERYLQTRAAVQSYFMICGGVGGLLGAGGIPAIDPATNARYDHTRYPELNGGAGIRDELGGNELPNAPHWTANIGAQYGFDILDGWRATVRGDLYWQSQSYHRVYNYEPYDKLHGWYNANLSVWIERPDDDLKIELYVKNLLDDTPITDAFLNSDDSALTTNVFTLDPRLIGLSIRKGF